MSEEIQISPEMIKWWEGMLATTPHPELSSVDDGSIEGHPSLNQMLEDVINISKTGKIETESQRTSYNTVKDGYDSYLAQQDQH